MSERHVPAGFAIVGIEPHLNQRMREHFLKHRGVAILWQSLEFFREIAIVTIRPDWDAPTHRGIEIFCIALPLLARVILEEHFVTLPSNLRYNSLFGVFWIVDVTAPLGEFRLHF